MYRAHLAVVELRERALAAREKAGRARRMAKHTTGDAGEAFRRQATEFDAKAALLESQLERDEIGRNRRGFPTRMVF